MSSSNKLPAADYRLKNMTNSLYLTESGDVAIRTGITGDINITGPVTIPGTVTVNSSPENPVHVHVTESVEVEIKNDSGNAIPISANTSPNSPTNRLYVSQQTDVALADSNYYMNVARGLVDSQYVEFKNGYWLSMNQTGGDKTIWSQATAYPWSSWTTAQKLYIISDSASDTGQSVYIDGLDSSYNKISETVTTNGLTAVQTTNNYLRINHVYLTAGNVNVGQISQRLTSGTGTIIGAMLAGLGRNKQGVFTVPAGYTAYILYGDVTSYKNGTGQVDGQINMKVRTSATAPFVTQFAAIASNGQYRNEFKIPLVVPQRADVDVMYAPSGTCTVACNWQMILIPN